MVQYSADTHRSTSGAARLRVLFAVLLVAIASMALAPAAFAQSCPAGVNITAPSASTNVPTQGKFEWTVTGSPAVAADYFTVNLYDGGSCSGTLLASSNTTFSAVSTYMDYYDLAPNTTYSITVTAIKDGCATPVTSACKSFTTSACHSNGPGLINPVKDTTADHTKVVFAWDFVLGNPTGYEVFVQLNSTGDFVSQGTTGPTVNELTRDIAPGTHKWYVEAILPGGCPRARSETWAFGTGCPSAPANLITPSGGATVASRDNVTFNWSAVPGADGYNVFLVNSSLNGGQPVQIGQTREGTELAGASITYTIPATSTDPNFTWYVDALSSSCPTLRSNTGSFILAADCPSATQAAGAVAATAPAAGATGLTSPVTLSWTYTRPGNTQLPTAFVVKARLGTSGVTTVATVPATGAATYSTSFNASPGTWGWFVEVQYANCGSAQSAERTFTVATPVVCLTDADRPTLGTPVVNQQTGAVTFNWTGKGTPTAYTVYAGVNGATPTSVGTTTGATTLNTVLPPGAVTWYVVGSYDACPSLTSDNGTFTISAPCPTVAPTLAGPAAGASVTRQVGSPTTFTWNPLQGVKSYTLTVGTTVIRDLTDPFYNLAIDNDGQVSWTVTAVYGGNCPDVTSAARILTVNSPPPCILETPGLVSPSANAETLSPTITFRWNAVANATSYDLMRRLPNGDVKLGSTTTTEFEKSFDFEEFTFDANRLASLDWYVVARGAASCTQRIATDSIPVRRLNLKKALVCNTAAPVLVTPASGSTTTSTTVSFVWNSAANAVGYKVWYRLNAGADTLLSQTALPATATSATYTVPQGVLEWWVEALFVGCDAQKSLTRTLTVQPPPQCPAYSAPTILGPATATALTAPVSLSWTRVSAATSYDVYAETATGSAVVVATVPQPASGNVSFFYSASPGPIKWWVRVNVANCGSKESASSTFTVAAPVTCGTPGVPTNLSIEQNVTSGQPYTLTWAPVPNATTYDVEESTNASFNPASAPVNTFRITGNSAGFTHTVDGNNTQNYFYRVRARSSCSTAVGEFSQNAAKVRVEPAPVVKNDNQQQQQQQQTTTNVGVGAQQVILRSTFFANPTGVRQNFTARTNETWLTVSPAAGVMPIEGMTFTILTDPSNLGAGTNVGSIIVEFTGAASNGVASYATTTYTIPVTVNIVTPVQTQGKSEPPSDALIIPAVASAEGANGSQWVSDLRVTNTSGDPGRYQVTFTPSQNDASRNSNQTSVDIPAGSSMALDSVLRNWFGARSADNVGGVVEIRALATGSSNSARRGRVFLGSSRTYNRTAGGTFGQFIPAIPVSDFAGKGEVLTVSEINQSATARTNLGLVEGSGQGATVRVTVFDANGTQLTTFDQFLRAGEHVQMNAFLASKGITNDNARANVEVTSANGRVMAYASVVDNQTNDPLLVAGDIPVADTAWVIAGVADLDTGAARWRTDVRIYNPTAAAVPVTLVYYPSGTPTDSKTITTTINARSTKELKDILRNSFTLTATGGAVHVKTATATPLLVTARTYNLTTTGTYGQYIPGVPMSEGIGKDGGTMQIQQLEGSANYRTNIGLAEVTGKPVKVELIAIVPGSLATPRLTVDLKANEFMQLLQVFSDRFGIKADVFNGRIAVRVIEGDGKIIAYGSVVDQKTQDPTFVPAER